MELREPLPPLHSPTNLLHMLLILLPRMGVQQQGMSDLLEFSHPRISVR